MNQMSKSKFSDLFFPLLITFGLAFNITYLFLDYLYNTLFLFAFILLLFLFVFYVPLIIFGFLQFKKKPFHFATSLAFILITLAVHFYNPNLFRSPQILNARLTDDLYAYDLTIYEDGSCVTKSYMMFGFTEEFWGECSVMDNKVLFHKDHYDFNSLYPDTAFIINGKLILNFDKAGQPDTSYSNYFEIINK
jgi:hypothetical protein